MIVGIEIERKFTLKNDSWKQQVSNTKKIRQGYLVTGLDEQQPASVRVRISDDAANLNIKSAMLSVTRQEFEYAIPVADAETLLNTLCEKSIIEKTRHIVVHATKTWEIDVFEGDNAGLVLAEIELDTENETIELPDWIGREVSEDPRYYNVYLVTHPYKTW